MRFGQEMTIGVRVPPKSAATSLVYLHHERILDSIQKTIMLKTHAPEGAVPCPSPSCVVHVVDLGTTECAQTTECVQHAAVILKCSGDTVLCIQLCNGAAQTLCRGPIIGVNENGDGVVANTKCFEFVDHLQCKCHESRNTRNHMRRNFHFTHHVSLSLFHATHLANLCVGMFQEASIDLEMCM